MRLRPEIVAATMEAAMRPRPSEEVVALREQIMIRANELIARARYRYERMDANQDWVDLGGECG